MSAHIQAPAAAVRHRHRQIDRSWKRTPRTIISADVVWLDGLFLWLDPRSYFRASVTYEYVVDGVRYLSDRVGFGGIDFSNLRRLAQRNADRFQPGAPVEVLYDPGIGSPRKPPRSRLIPPLVPPALTP